MLREPGGPKARRPIATLGAIAEESDPRPDAPDSTRKGVGEDLPRATSGLGRGLAGILDDALSSAPTPGVDSLVGADGVRRSPEVRELVTSVALQTLAEGVGADGVVLVRRDLAGDLATVSSQLPNGWTALTPVGFEVIGRLHRHLDPVSAELERSSIGPHHFLLCRHDLGQGVTAAAVVRSTPFTDHEERVVGNLVRSVGACLGEPVGAQAADSFDVYVEDAPDGVLADVRLGSAGQRRHVAAVGPTMVDAVARAAAELCAPSMRVSFAGAVEVDGRQVTLVVVTDAAGAPLFGLSVADSSSRGGAAEAVFSAARLLDLGPFAVDQATT